MTGPREISAELRKIAQTIENSKNPDKNLVIRDLKKIAALLSNVIEKEQADAVAAMDMLISRLEKTDKSLDVQHPAKKDVEDTLRQIKANKAALMKLLEEFRDISV
jgi:hypothetical protein